jgi:hypothetical protein
MLFRPTVFGVITLIFVAVARAQTPDPVAKPTNPVAVENTNASFSPTDVSIPEASPARPTVTAPAHIPPTGYLQFEQGFSHAHGSPGGLSAQSALNQTTKIALTTRLLVQFVSQPYTHNVTPPFSSNDPGDLDLGAQFILHKAAGSLPVIAVGYLHRLRAGTAGNLDVGDYAQSSLLLFSGDLPGAVHYDANVILNDLSSDQNLTAAPHSIHRAQFAQSVALSHPLFPKATASRLTGVFELSHFTQPFVSTPTVARANTIDLLSAVNFALRPNLVFDADFGHGLTSTSTQWQGGFGLTYLLPHRLWPDRHPISKPVGPFKYHNPR